MFYHGTVKSSEAPFAHADKHTFWVYPSYLNASNKWDTHMAAKDYCNNHVDEGPPSQDFRLKQYVCLGHASKDDVSVAKAEWLGRLPVNETMESYKQILVEYPRLSGMFANLIERIEALEKNKVTTSKLVEELLERVEVLESKVEEIQEDDDMVERVEALESKMEEIEMDDTLSDDEIIEQTFEETFGKKAEEVKEEEAEEVEEVAKEEEAEEAEEAETIYDVKVREAEEACCTELDYLASAAAVIYLIFFAFMFIRMNTQKAVVLSSRELEL